MLSNNKITARQTVIIFLVSTLSAAIRLFPSETAEISEEAAWLTPLVAVLPLSLIFFVLDRIFRDSSYSNLGEFFEAALGKIIGKALLTVFLLWSLILFMLYIRYYADRLLSSIFTGTDIRFFLLIMMLLVFMAARGRVVVFARFAELAFIAFFSFMFIFFIMLIPSIKIENILPITYYDIIPVVKASYSVAGIWCYLPLLFFFGDDITNKNQIKDYKGKTAVLLAVTCILLILTVVGSIGPKVIQRMPLPFFNAVKIIAISQLFERMESVLLSIWVASDFVVISAFAYIIIGICKQLFGINQGKYLSAPLALLGYSGSLYLAASRFELHLFSNKFGLPMNIITCIIIPFIVMVIGKLRRKI